MRTQKLPHTYIARLHAPPPLFQLSQKCRNSIFSKITPTVPPKPNQATPTPIPPDREMRVTTHHNIETSASDVRVQNPTRLLPPMIPKSIPNHPTPQPPPPTPHHTTTQLLGLGLPPQSSHNKLTTSTVNLDTYIPIPNQPK